MKTIIIFPCFTSTTTPLHVMWQFLASEEHYSVLKCAVTNHHRAVEPTLSNIAREPSRGDCDDLLQQGAERMEVQKLSGNFDRSSRGHGKGGAMLQQIRSLNMYFLEEAVCPNFFCG